MNWLKDLYQNNAFFHGFVAALEGGAIGAITDGTFDYSGLFTKDGFKRLLVAIGTGAAIAVRNYLKNRPNQPAGNAKA